MQTIWARAAQLGNACRCPHCTSSIQGISRRTTASATQRTPRYLTTSTLLYSGIFAVATTYDAKSKRERREQWDQAIADIREELDQPSGIQDQAIQKTEQSLKEAPLRPAYGIDSQLIVFGSGLDSTTFRQHKHWAPQTTAGRVKAVSFAPQSLYAPDDRKQSYMSRPWTELKLERVRLCMDKFQLDIIRELHKAGLSQDAVQHVPFAYSQFILSSPTTRTAQCHQKLGDIARLRGQDQKLQTWKRSVEDVPLNAYQMDAGGHFIERTRHLNQTLQILFRRRAKERISRAELLAKVSYHIGTCPTPPDVDTFNTLIVGFAHLQEKHLYNCTTIALSQTRVRPNEVTLASIFKYDAESNDTNHFCSWLRKLRGMDGGLYAARGDIEINDTNKSRLFRRPDSNSGAIIQLPSPTPMVFNALVGGILRFFGFDAALGVCEDLGDEGWGLSMAGLQVLLEDCADRGDWKPGMAIWNKIQQLKANSRKRIWSNWNSKMMRLVWKSEKIELPAYVSMLKLCRKASERKKFEEIITETTKEHQIKLPRLIRMLKDESRTVPHPKPQAMEQKVDRKAVSPPKRLVINQDELHGLVPGNPYLNEYELYERPMSI